MNQEVLEKRYNAIETEERWYSLWEERGYFRPASDWEKPDPPKGPYTIVIPPPNVTGILHMGHALNNSIQDILIRWNRMRGFDTLWVPGVDHAGIATQNVVEKKLAKEKKTRQELGRTKFLGEVWKWKDEHGNTITRQLRKLGASCDWSRERFTMDAGLSAAVREAFVLLHERGLIYQGHYIINWCPRCGTALSDEEAAHKEVHGGLYHIKYPIAGHAGPFEKIGEDHIVVATTRPETMLGDTAVAVHPGDERYRHLVGKKVLLPLMDREIPVVADSFVDPEFGTGMVKVTPAHDPNDFEIGNRHGLERVNVLAPDGKVNDRGGLYAGLDRFEARRQIVEDLKSRGLFIRRDSHLHAVGHCYRCDSMVEPYLSKQWFVRMKPLAEKALRAHAEGKVRFYPDRWTKVYTNWLEGIRDWCISRQIWWGHQVPVWYDGDGNVFVARSAEEAKAKAFAYHGKEVELAQDPDVLDTWFSSWLWPFSTLGWPEKTPDLGRFYPTADLITASEIIFFWVSRMIMAGLEFLGEVPFKRVFIHGTVRAETGLKMSKSLGNSIDPLEIIHEMGADALRFSMMMLSAQDVYLSREKFEVGRNFTNKIWNAARFLFMNFENFSEAKAAPDFGAEPLSVPDRWILLRLQKVAAQVDAHLEGFGFSQAAGELYHFIWNDFCDWYIELAKPVLGAGDVRDKAKTQKILFFIFEKICRLLHPFMPFLTEELWHRLKGIAVDRKDWPESLMRAVWPDLTGLPGDPAAEKEVEMLQAAVSGMRELRAKLGIPPARQAAAVIHVRDLAAGEVFRRFAMQVKILARLESLEVLENFAKDRRFVGNSFSSFDAYLCVEGLVNFDEEKKRLESKIEETQRWIKALTQKLANDDFVRHAPEEVVRREREKLEDAQKRMQSYEANRSLFDGGEARG